MQKPLCGIYYIKNMINNKYYIGQALDVKKRWRREKYELNRDSDAWNVHLQRSWKLYGKENFQFSVIETCSAEKLDEREQFWIEFYDAYHNGYNQSLGGSGVSGWKHTEESRVKISESNLLSITPERRKAVSEWAHEYWSNTENRERIRELKKQWWSNPDNKEKMQESIKNSNRIYTSGENHPMYGATRSGLNSGHHKSCVQIETGIFYYTLTEASKQTGANVGKICEACKGNRKTAGGYHWRYATKKEVENYLRKMEVAV